MSLQRPRFKTFSGKLFAFCMFTYIFRQTTHRKNDSTKGLEIQFTFQCKQKKIADNVGIWWIDQFKSKRTCFWMLHFVFLHPVNLQWRTLKNYLRGYKLPSHCCTMTMGTYSIRRVLSTALIVILDCQ